MPGRSHRQALASALVGLARLAEERGDSTGSRRLPAGPIEGSGDFAGLAFSAGAHQSFGKERGRLAIRSRAVVELRHADGAVGVVDR